MEPSFWGVMVYVLPALAIVYLLIRKHGHEERATGHNMYRNYRKTRMDKPVL